MKNYEVFIIVAVLVGIGYYFWQNTQKTVPATGGASVKISSNDNCNKNLFQCNSFKCGMISRVVLCCGQVI